MIIVEHVGGEWPLKLVPVGVFDHFLFGLLLLLFLRLGFIWAARHASSRSNSLLELVLGFVFVSAARLCLLCSN